MSGTAVAYDEAHRHHRSGRSHPERPARVDTVVEALQASGTWSRLRPVPAREATDDEVLAAHAASYLDTLRRRSEAADAGEEEGDMYWTTASRAVALRAAGGAVDLVRGVLEGKFANGVGVLRPPSHHAGRDSASGFCHLNAAAIAAKAAIARHGARRVAIVDWDVHHGDGTQDIVGDDPAILYFSVHRHDRGAFFPHTGRIADGPPWGDPAHGTVVNVPWPTGGLGDGELALALDAVASPILRAFAPDVIIVSAGFDAAAGDPLGGMFASPAGFAYLTARLRDIAGGRILLLLEGGYSLDALARCVTACVTELEREPSAAVPRPLAPALAPDAVACLLRTAAHHTARAWPGLWGPTAPLLAAASAAGGGGSSSDEEEREGRDASPAPAPSPLPAPAAAAELATLQRALGDPGVDAAAVPGLLSRLLATARSLAAGPSALGRCWADARLYEQPAGEDAVGSKPQPAWTKRGAVTVVLAGGSSPRLLLLSSPGSCIADVALEPSEDGVSPPPSPAVVLAGGGAFDLSPRSVVLSVARGDWPAYALRLASDADAAGLAAEWRRLGGRVEEGVGAPAGVEAEVKASASDAEQPSLQEAARRRFEAMRARRRGGAGKPPVAPSSGEAATGRGAAAAAGAGDASGAEASSEAGSEGEGEGEEAPLPGLRCHCALAVDASQWPLRPVLEWRSDEVRQVASLTKLATAVVVMQTIRRRVGSKRRLYPEEGGSAGGEGGYTAPLNDDGEAGGEGKDCDDEATAAALQAALGEEVTVNANSAATRGTTASLREGEVYTVKELLLGMMLPSGNDAATALAWNFGAAFEPLDESEEPFGGSKYYPGSMDRASPWSRFVGEMNRASRALGLADTRFGNPHGMMHERHRSTAWDMAVLAFHAMRDPVLQGIAATRRHAVTLETGPPPPPSAQGSGEEVSDEEISQAPTPTPLRDGWASDSGSEATPFDSSPAVEAEASAYPRRVVWSNTNKLLAPRGRLYTVDGVKTGITWAAGGCLVTRAVGVQDVAKKLIVVTLASPNKQLRFVDNQRVLAHAWSLLEEEEGGDAEE